MPNVHIHPLMPRNADPGDGGIRQVLRQQHDYLPDLGWTVVDDPAEADVIACHAEIPDSYLKRFPRTPMVVHNHGAYWTEYRWANWSYQSNVHGMKAIRTANVTTAVSLWTAQTLRRHSNRDIRVVHNGIDLDEWKVPEDPTKLPIKNAGRYVLWNKTRVDSVCDVTPLDDLAREMPETPFVSTFGEPGGNVFLTGKLPFEEAKQIIQAAGVYLCTTRETFGIGTLEALACGVPVVGYDWGGQTEIIENGVDGWLVQADDIKALAEAVEWALENRETLSVNARRKAEMFPAINQVRAYAEVYNEVLAVSQVRDKSPKVSVVVPAYNLARFLPGTLDSIAAQDFDDWECIIVDDASPDECGEIADAYAAGDPRFRVIHNETNQYLSNARNIGIAAARGEYILPLDADDRIAQGTLAVLSGALDEDRLIDIAYGNVLFVEEDGRSAITYAGNHEPGHSGWPRAFRLDQQLEGPGQLLPYSSMFRKKVWQLTGGYRTRIQSSEDCDFWLRTSSYGFEPRMVTGADTLVYLVREDSMSQTEGFQDHLHRKWYPWIADPRLMPAAAVRPIDAGQLPYPSLDPPVITVVIPIGPGHGMNAVTAIDSVDAQHFRHWEVIVVNDSGEDLPLLPQWVRVLCNDPECPCVDGDPCHYRGADPWPWLPPAGVARARNRALGVARTPLFLPLDADDFLQPEAMTMMFDAFLDSASCRSIIYPDWWEDNEDQGHWTHYQTDDYRVDIVDGRERRGPDGEKRGGVVHSVVALTPVAYWREVGGYDESLPAWEDWGFQIKTAAAGFCSRRVPRPLFNYSKHSGFRRSDNYVDFDESRDAMMTADFGIGAEGLMPCSTCGGGRGNYNTANGEAGYASGPPSDDYATVEYTGSRGGTFRLRGTSGSTYAFSASRREAFVLKIDLPNFAGRGDFIVRDRPSMTEMPTEPVVEPQRHFGGGELHIPSIDHAKNDVIAQMGTAPEAPAPGTQPTMVALADGGYRSVDPDETLHTHDDVASTTPLAKMTRPELNAEATRLGVTEPEGYDNKAALTAAIESLREFATA
jgi:glycosyltransferase involved in cell wall biosynthesis/GT2 family glycosyltransferase